MQALILLMKVLHWVIVVYSVTVWLATSVVGLIAYLIWVPTMVIQWRFNENSCLVNNIESWLTTGKWRDEGNPEEGAFVRTALFRVVGCAPSKEVFDVLIRVLLLVLWTVAFMRWRGM